MFLRIQVFLGSRFLRFWVQVLEVSLKLIVALNFSLLRRDTTFLLL